MDKKYIFNQANAYIRQSSKNKVLKLFNDSKLLVRAMDLPQLIKYNNDLMYDFTVWAEEIDIAKNDKLTCISSTLLVADEQIHTYKGLGFIINSEHAEIVHVADSDSGSKGNILYGNFSANETNLHSLSDLADKTKKEHLYNMNEVNVNIGEDAIIGLFINKSVSNRLTAFILMAQEYYKMHTGITLPIFVYDKNNGTLEALDISDQEKNDILNSEKQKNTIKSLTICYESNDQFKQKTLCKDSQESYIFLKHFERDAL